MTKGDKMKYDKIVTNIPSIPGQWDKLEDRYYLKDKLIKVVKHDKNKKENKMLIDKETGLPYPHIDEETGENLWLKAIEERGFLGWG